MCCAAMEFDETDIDGVCPECGVDTVVGEAYEQCGYSPECCNICDYSPCDQSC